MEDGQRDGLLGKCKECRRQVTWGKVKLESGTCAYYTGSLFRTWQKHASMKHLPRLNTKELTHRALLDCTASLWKLRDKSNCHDRQLSGKTSLVIITAGQRHVLWCWENIKIWLMFCTFWLGVLCSTACCILVSWTGVDPGTLVVTVWNPNHWTAREFPHGFVLNKGVE